MFPDKLRVSSFCDRFPHYARTASLSAHFDFVGSRVYACLGVTCHLHFLPEWPGSFTCHCGNTVVERTPNKSQHTKLTLEKKILPPLLPGFELATFRSRVRRPYQQAVPDWIVGTLQTATGYRPAGFCPDRWAQPISARVQKHLLKQ